MSTDKKAALEKLPMLLKEAASYVGRNSTKLAELEETNKELLHELTAMKLAQRMTERGMDPETSWESKVASLKAMSSEKLATMGQAIELAQGPLTLPKVAKDFSDTQSTNTPGFDDFILSQTAFG